jgi:hypothetical protein
LTPWPRIVTPNAVTVRVLAFSGRPTGLSTVLTVVSGSLDKEDGVGLDPAGVVGRAALYGGAVSAGPAPDGGVVDAQPLQRFGFRMLLESTPTPRSSARPFGGSPSCLFRRPAVVILGREVVPRYCSPVFLGVADGSTPSPPARTATTLVRGLGTGPANRPEHRINDRLRFARYEVAIR